MNQPIPPDLIRMLHRIIDQRIEAVERDRPRVEKLRGIVSTVTPSLRVASVRLDGSTLETPYIPYPAMTPIPEAGDEVIEERSRDGWMLLSDILGRDPDVLTWPWQDLRDYNDIRGDNETDCTSGMLLAYAEMEPGSSLDAPPGRYRIAPDTVLIPSLDRLHDSPTYGLGHHPTMIAPGGMATFLPTGPGDFLFASKAWYDNIAGGGTASWAFENIDFDADNLVERCVIWRGYQTAWRRCRFSRATIDQFLFTRLSRDGTTLSSTFLSNGRWHECIFRGADGTPSTGALFQTGPTSGVGSAGYGPADGWMTDSYFYANGAPYNVHLRNTSHWFFQGNAYAQAAIADLRVKNLSPGFRFNDYIETLVEIDSTDGGAGPSMTVPGFMVNAGNDGEEFPYMPWKPGATPLSVRALTGQTAMLFKVLADDDTVLAGFTAAGELQLGGASGPRDIVDAGDPEGAVTAPVGSTYRRTDGGAGTTWYVKEVGDDEYGWAAK